MKCVWAIGVADSPSGEGDIGNDAPAGWYTLMLSLIKLIGKAKQGNIGKRVSNQLFSVIRYGFQRYEGQDNLGG